MWIPFRGKKPKKKEASVAEAELFDGRTLRAKVFRTYPPSFRGKVTKGLAREGDWQHIASMDDLEARVDSKCGGGDFRIELYNQVDNKYVRSITLNIQGDPKINGEEIPEPDKKAKVQDEPERVKEIKEKTEIAKAEAQYRETLKSAGMKLPEEEESQPSELDELRGQVAEILETRGQDTVLDREERRHEEAMRAMREQSNQTMQMFTQMITALVGSRGGDNDKTFEMMKTITESQTRQIETVVRQMETNRQAQETSQSEMLKLVIAKSDDMTRMFMEQMHSLVNMRGTTADDQFAFFSKALQTAAQFAEGRLSSDENDAQSWPSLVDRLSGRLFETVQGALALKGQQAEINEEKFRAAVKEAVLNVTSDAKALPNPPAGNPSPAAAAPPKQVPPKQAAPKPVPTQARPPAAKPKSQATGQPNAQKGMDTLLTLFLEDAAAERVDPWARVQHFAPKLLPLNVIGELAEARSKDGNAFAKVIRKYASSQLAERALQVAAGLAEPKSKPESNPPEKPAPTAKAEQPETKKPKARPKAKRQRSRSSLAEAASQGASERAKGKPSADSNDG